MRRRFPLEVTDGPGFLFYVPIVATAARNAKSWRRLLDRWILARRDRPHAPF